MPSSSSWAARAPIDLLAKRAGTSPAPGAAARDYRRHWTPVHLDFVVEDIDAVVERAVVHGATIEQAARDEPFGRIAHLADPFGHGLCVLKMSERGYDALLDASDEG